MTTRATGIALAFVTAVVSGVAVYVNSRGVTHFDDATVYTTAKNALEALLLALALPLLAGPRTRGRAARPATRRQWLGVAAVACIGGSVPFVLFFEGLARADATQAAFIHKTLVVRVALLAVLLLRERLGSAHVAAIGLVLAGQAWLAGGAGTAASARGDDDPGGDAALGGRGRARQAAARRAGAAPARGGPDGARDGRPRRLARLHGPRGRPAGARRRADGLPPRLGLLLAGYVASWYAALARAGRRRDRRARLRRGRHRPDRERGRRSGARPGRPDPRHCRRGADRLAALRRPSRPVAAP